MYIYIYIYIYTYTYFPPGTFFNAVDFPWLSSNLQHLLRLPCTSLMLSNIFGTNPWRQTNTVYFP